ncbi:LpxA family transferase [Chromobacterium sinusclupearum]|uniref:LpxA family transferase n=1 Tax=Chromobacterium sinusclupearum TaxID=2077146 RepID=A0A2K4MHW1_9NEIS|nr:LpxA family transferase [Chromobacterium sinusclupearum]POA96673.1 LpxA family transferase [Chromobacterium sinusclupearum]
MSPFHRLFSSAVESLPWIDAAQEPWQWLQHLSEALRRQRLRSSPEEWIIDGEAMIHRSAVLERGVTLKGPIWIGPGCRVAAHAYLRGGVVLCDGVTIGPGCEVKTSIIGPGSRLAHFNFVGDSVLDADVNLEAGAILANHWNERADKTIRLLVEGRMVLPGVEKLGALLASHVRIGANAVLSPGTVLPMGTVVPRLALIEQDAGIQKTLVEATSQ